MLDARQTVRVETRARRGFDHDFVVDVAKSEGLRDVPPDGLPAGSRHVREANDIVGHDPPA